MDACELAHDSQIREPFRLLHFVNQQEQLRDKGITILNLEKAVRNYLDKSIDGPMISAQKDYIKQRQKKAPGLGEVEEKLRGWLLKRELEASQQGTPIQHRIRRNR